MLRSRNGKFRQGVGIWLWVTNLAAKLYLFECAGGVG